MNKKIFLLIVTIFCLSRPLYAENQPSCKIVTSFSVLEDMVKTITGPLCKVQSIVGPNQDAHVFEPKPTTNALILGADAVIINGLGFEGWMDRLLKASSYRGPVITATQYIKPRYLHQPDRQEASVPDPHAWHTIPNAILYIQALTETLSKIFPFHQASFKKNADIFQKQLWHIEQSIQTRLSAIPLDKRRVITAHDAFGYMGQHYQITFLSPVGISTEAEPSARQIAALINQIRHSGIRALFIENSANTKIMQQIADETGVKIWGQLYSDALSLPDEPAPTYIDMIRHNMSILIASMQQ